MEFLSRRNGGSMAAIQPSFGRRAFNIERRSPVYVHLIALLNLPAVFMVRLVLTELKSRGLQGHVRLRVGRVWL